MPVLVIHQRNRFYQYLHSFEYLSRIYHHSLLQIILNVIDLIDLFFNGDLDLFWHIVCFSTVLWVIIVEVSLSDCLSGQLHSHHFLIYSLLHYFSHSFTIDCFVGLALPHLANNLI